MVGKLALCFLLMLNSARFSSARLLMNRTRGVMMMMMMSREVDHRRNLVGNGLGQTPPMG